MFRLKNASQKSQKGIALIMVLGVLSVLVIISLEYALSMRLEQKIAHNYLMSKTAALASESGIEEMVRVLRSDYLLTSSNWYSSTYSFKTRAYDYYGEAWGKGLFVNDTNDTGYWSDSRYMTTAHTSLPTTQVTYNLSTNFQDDTTDGHFLQGIQDEQGKININTNQFRNLDKLRVVLGLPGYQSMAQSLDKTATIHTYETIQESFYYGGSMTGIIYYGEDINDTNDHVMSSGEDNDSNGVLRPGLEDFITVHGSQISDSGVLTSNFLRDTFAGIPHADSPININTASWAVLYANCYAVYQADAEARILATEIRDWIDGSNDQMDTSDDNPFDGLRPASNFESNIFGGALTEPMATHMEADGVDNNGDGYPDSGDVYMYAGGARGEFEFFLDELQKAYSGQFTVGEMAEYKMNFCMMKIRDFSGSALFDGPDGKITHSGTYNTAYDNQTGCDVFCFSSDHFTITVTGKKIRDDGTLASSSKRRRIIQRNAP